MKTHNILCISYKINITSSCMFAAQVQSYQTWGYSTVTFNNISLWCCCKSNYSLLKWSAHRCWGCSRCYYSHCGGNSWNKSCSNHGLTCSVLTCLQLRLVVCDLHHCLWKGALLRLVRADRLTRCMYRHLNKPDTTHSNCHRIIDLQRYFNFAPSHSNHWKKQLFVGNEKKSDQI